jgi:hypothetical protein
LLDAQRLVVDDDPPTVTIDPLPNGGMLRGSALVLGGDAADATGWVEQVDVDAADGNGYLTAAGSASWAITWQFPGGDTPYIALFLGESRLSYEIDLDVQTALRITGVSASARGMGVGDVDGDGYSDFVVVDGSTLYRFAGAADLTAAYGASITIDEAVATLTSGDAAPVVLGAGDVDGDALADFLYSDGSTPHLVQSTGGTRTFTGYGGFLVAPGDVNSDGFSDLLLGKTDQTADLVLGGDFTVQATVQRVTAAASALFGRGSDFNSDGSGDLLALPVPGAATLTTPASGVAVASTVHVYAAAGDCGDCAPGDWGTTAFTGIQTAIDSGAARVLLHPGHYTQTFALADNVQVLGSGAENTIVAAPTGLVPGTPLVLASDIQDAQLAGLTLRGDTAVDGVRVGDGSQAVLVSRLIVEDMAVALHVDGSTTQAEFVNNTIVNNITGLRSTGCAAVDVRNSLFAFHKGKALDYDEACPVVHRHTYNAYWASQQDYGTKPLAYWPVDNRVWDSTVVPDAAGQGHTGQLIRTRVEEARFESHSAYRPQQLQFYNYSSLWVRDADAYWNEGYLQVPDDADFDLGTGPFALSLWFRLNDHMGDLFTWRNTGSGGDDDIALYVNGDAYTGNRLYVRMITDGADGLLVYQVLTLPAAYIPLVSSKP